MASISSLTGGSSSSSSIYGNRNVISGLASGMDTEAMIENMVSGYESKLTSLQQEKTKTEWKQEAYREIISKLSSYLSNYCTYSSSTNLLSKSYFNSANYTTASGTYSDLVSTSGTTKSDLSLLGVKQLATAATLSIKASDLLGSTNTAEKAVSLDEVFETGTVSGTLSLEYSYQDGDAYTGDTVKNTINLTFDSGDVIKSDTELVDAINSKLKAQGYTDITASFSDSGQLSFTDGSGKTNAAISVTGATGNVADSFGVEKAETETGEESGEYVIKGLADDAKLYNESTVRETLDGKTIRITLDGVTKEIALSTVNQAENGNVSNKTAAEVVEALQEEINKTFGTNADGSLKLEVGGAISDKGLQLSFAAKNEGSTFSVTGSSEVQKALGMDGALTNTLDVKGVTLGDILGDDAFEKGDLNLTINGVEIGSYGKDTNLNSLFTDINDNDEAGVTVTFSELTGKLTFTAEETGRGSKLKFGGTLGGALFDNDAVKEGDDAIFSVKVNGETMDLTRSSNTFELDGMTLTLKGEFGYDDADNRIEGTSPVVFTTTTNSSKIVENVKKMVEDLNAIMAEVKGAFSTMPEQKSNGDYYEPLTDEDKSDMSEYSVEEYEKKAKAGLLFGDSDLSSLYYSILDSLNSNVMELKSIGIEMNYADGLTVLTLDEEKLTSALETDVDAVAEVFAGDGDSKGLVASLQSTLETYGKTTGTKGILVNKAGSTLAPSTLYTNDIYMELQDIEEEISKWQEFINSQIDHYTSKFTYLEQLIAEMNNQSSMLFGMSGG